MDQESKHVKLSEEKWDKFSERIDGKGWIHEYLRRAQRGVISLLDLKENVHFLDVGCGTGWAVYQAAQRVNNVGVFCGIDLSSKMIEKAKENFRGEKDFHFLKANAESLPLDNDFFDVVISTNSFHHYFNPVKALGEIFRVLKPGGKIYIEDPTADRLLFRIVNRITKLFRPDDVNLHSTQEFKELFAKAGLKYIGTEVLGFSQKVHIGEK
jgi:ubiquinone/menaquinone biosynthesis C-methylase UbiE